MLFERDTNGYDCYRIPAIVEVPPGRSATGKQGTLLAFAEARKDVDDDWCDDAGDIDLVVRRSIDGGEHDGRIVLLTTHNPAGSSTPRTPYVQYSTFEQDGTGWSDPVNIEDMWTRTRRTA